MAILKGCEVWYAKLNPKKPARKYNPENPTWEVQLRTRNKVQKDEWAAIPGIKVKVKMSADETTLDYWYVNLRKKSLKEGKVKKVYDEPAAPVEVVNGKMEEIDPDTIGNGSICSIRLFLKKYNFAGKDGTSAMLTAVQVTKHIVYVPSPMESFDEEDTETIMPDDDDVDEDGLALNADSGVSSTAPAGAPVDVKPDAMF